MIDENIVFLCQFRRNFRNVKDDHMPFIGMLHRYGSVQLIAVDDQQISRGNLNAPLLQIEICATGDNVMHLQMLMPIGNCDLRFAFLPVYGKVDRKLAAVQNKILI